MNILVMNFFPAFQPPTSGGELRLFNIYYQLSKYHDITLLSPTYSDHKLECVKFSDTFREYRIPKENVHNQLHMDIDKEVIGPEVSALVCALSSRKPNKYHEYYNKLYPSADIIIHDFPYMLEYDLFFGLDNKPRIYNSHNYESLLVKQIWKGPNAPKYFEYINDLERRLVLGSRFVFTTSEEEKNSFISEFGAESSQIHLAPNGINPDDWTSEGVPKRYKRQKNKQVKALFIGSAHPPNIEATEFIINNVAPKCQNIEFVIAGNCCDTFKARNVGNNVKLLGRIDEKTKEEIFVNTDLAINPMFSGAGTNLKTLEYLSAGIPLISTDCGVRGIELKNSEHFILANRDDFAEKVIELLNDEGLMMSISKKGMDYINAHFSWQGISNNIHSRITSIKPIEDRRKLVFILNDFECSSPVSGGEVRIHQLYSNLSTKYYKILLLCLNGHGEIKRTNINDNFVEISVPKTNNHLEQEVAINRQHWISATDIVTSYMCSENELLKKISVNSEDIADVIILTHPYMVELLERIDKPIIYESHNFETDLKMKLLTGHPKYEFLIEKVKAAETKAMQLSKIAISVSDSDHKGLNSLIQSNKRVFTIRNGVKISNDFEDLDVKSVKRLFETFPTIIFIGSSHQPNVEAANFIVNELAVELSECYFLIIGSVCDSITGIVPDNVLLFGKLDEVYKNVLLKIADIAINPMTSGSGSNLKLAEYFANKLPVVTTSFGARGFAIENMNEAIICDLKDTKNQISLLINDTELKSSLSANAFKYVSQELDWKILASKLDGIIKREIFKNQQKKKLLIVTYRFTNPPLGGAEAYMLNLIKEIDSIGDFSIDIASVNLKDLYNKYHFSISGSTVGNEKNIGLFQDTVLNYFAFDELSENKMLESSRVLYNTWMKESIKISLDHIDKYDKTMLLGGWYYPERSRDSYSVWSSGEALLFIDKANKIILRGISPKRKKIVLTLQDKTQILNKTVSGSFELIIEGNFNKDIVRITTDTHIDDSDPRTFGLILGELKVKNEHVDEEIYLVEDYKAFMKNKYPEQYIESMITIADKREKDIDSLFQRTRGPVSAELETWLNENVHQYDIILGHSIPFYTSVIASNYAQKFGKPYVIVPHFHMEDEFYHWKSYYEILRKADKVVAFPDKAIEWFYNKIKAGNTLSLPGGAVDPKEYVFDDDASFFAKYSSDLPYVLVLGRKTGAKNYKWVIEAVKKVNEKGKKCNLVLIGKDEDFEPVDPDEAYYFNELERPVVISALKHCSCLVTMSESESFGIVILEAWMQGKPVIVNEKCAAFVELVDDNTNGIVTSKDNLYSNIEKLINDKELAIILGNNGKKW